MLKDDIEKYIKMFEKKCTSAIGNFMQRYYPDSEHTKALDQIRAEHLERKRLEAEERSPLAKLNQATGTPYAEKKKKKTIRPERRQDITEPNKLRFVVGKCPKCGSNLLGEPVPQCSRVKDNNKRHFIKECATCAYYSEIFKDGNKFNEVEGG